MTDDPAAQQTVTPAVAKAMEAFHSGRALLAENARLNAEKERLKETFVASRVRHQEASVQAWRTVDALRAENERLSAILKEVRFFCTHDTYRADLHAKIWPLVVAFDNPADE